MLLIHHKTFVVGIVKKPFFSVKAGTIMHKSNLNHQDRHFYVHKNLKGIATMKLHGELEIIEGQFGRV